MSSSSELRNSSGLTSGSVEATGSVPPSSTAGAFLAPGVSSMNMSLRPVLGRSSAVQSLPDEALVLAVEMHLDDGPAAAQADLGDVAQPHARETRRSGPGPA